MAEIIAWWIGLTITIPLFLVSVIILDFVAKLFHQRRIARMSEKEIEIDRLRQRVKRRLALGPNDDPDFPDLLDVIDVIESEKEKMSQEKE